MITTIIKRDGREVPFNNEKIVDAIFKAACATGGNDRSISERMAAKVVEKLENQEHLSTPTVEQIQDAVERVLIEMDTPEPQKIIYFTEQNGHAYAK